MVCPNSYFDADILAILILLFGCWVLTKHCMDNFCLLVSEIAVNWVAVILMCVLFLLSKWTPTGRRLITGSQSGEFTLWNGQSFNFEMILQVHNCIKLHVFLFLPSNRSHVDGFWNFYSVGPWSSNQVNGVES